MHPFVWHDSCPQMGTYMYDIIDVNQWVYICMTWSMSISGYMEHKHDRFLKMADVSHEHLCTNSCVHECYTHWLTWIMSYICIPTDWHQSCHTYMYPFVDMNHVIQHMNWNSSSNIHVPVFLWNLSYSCVLFMWNMNHINFWIWQMLHMNIHIPHECDRFHRKC